MAEENGYEITGPHVEKTEEGSNYELFYLVNGAKFPVGVAKTGEFEARLDEAARAQAESASKSKK